MEATLDCGGQGEAEGTGQYTEGGNREIRLFYFNCDHDDLPHLGLHKLPNLRLG